MEQSKKPVSIALPRLDSFDWASILLWLSLLIPSIQLPSSATYTFLRSILFISLVAFFIVALAQKIMREKRILFFSASWGNYSVLLFTLAAIISVVTSAAKFDSLFGYDLSFTSSSLLIFSMVGLYFALKLAGLSLEIAVSRVLSVLPMTLLLSDILSLFAYILPFGVLTKLLGNYATYFTHFSVAPFALLGNTQQSLFIHAIALVIGVFQLITAQKRGSAAKQQVIKRSIILVLLSIPFTYFFYSLFAVTLYTSTIWILIGTFCLVLLYFYLPKDRSTMMLVFGSLVALTLLLGLIWNKVGIVGKMTTPVLTFSETSGIITKSFLNGATPMWRQLTGFGVSTFPYLFMQYRSIDIAKTFGNTVFFFRPNDFFTELFIEHGLLGVSAFIVIAISIVRAFISASSKRQLVPEVILLALIFAFFLTGSTSTIALATFFIVLASYFDKVESQPEMLPQIHAFDVKESYYTSRTVNRGNQLYFVLSLALLVVTLMTLLRPTLAMFSYSRAVQRITVSAAQSKQSSTAADSSKTLVNAYTLAQNSKSYCKMCAQLDYLKLNSLLSIYTYYDKLTEKERAESSELRQVKNMLLQATTDLLAQGQPRYDYWLTIAQSYKAFAVDEKAASFYVLTIQSLKNSLQLNPYSVDALVLYTETLFTVGSDAQINSELATSINVLKALVGTPTQIQFYDAILLARNNRYDEAISSLEKTKKEVESNTQLSDEQKSTYIKLADSSIADVKKLIEESKKPVTPTITPTPSASVTPTVSK